VSPSIRVRLTALYGGVFAVFVAVLMGASYVLMRGHLDRTLAPADADAALSQLATQYLVAFAGPTLLATALGWALAGRELRSMADAFARQERFVANASHELRSPLTVARTEVEVALADPDASEADLRAMGVDVLDSIDRMDELLDGLMLLAQSGRPPERRPVDLAGIARAAAGRVRPGGVRVRLDLDPVQVRGERRLLERLAENLVENGVRYNAPGGFVDVRTSAREKSAVLRVENSGPLVPEATAARLLEPFERGGRARDGGGAGLGLSIVRAVAEAHGGRVALAPRREGGLAVEVVLPCGQTRGSSGLSGQFQPS
jgi:signal transduction histidine kinase